MTGLIKRVILISRLEKLLKELLMNGKLTSRKFWLVVGVLIASYVLVWQGTLPVDKFMEWAKWILTAYLGANVLAKFGKKPG